MIGFDSCLAARRKVPAESRRWFPVSRYNAAGLNCHQQVAERWQHVPKTANSLPSGLHYCALLAPLYCNCPSPSGDCSN